VFDTCPNSRVKIKANYYKWENRRIFGEIVSELLRSAAARKLATGENKLEGIEGIGRTLYLNISFKDEADVKKFVSDLKKELVDVNIRQSIYYPEELEINNAFFTGGCVVLGRDSGGRITLRATTHQYDPEGEASSELLDRMMWSETLSSRLLAEGPWKGISSEELERKLTVIAPLAGTKR
jgi:hypothetical protein